MIDIHSHFLPGLDDGAPTAEVSLAMLEVAAENGITHIVGTPHCNAAYEYSQEKNQALAKGLQEKVGDRIRLMTGCDFHLSFENLEQLEENPALYTVNQGTYLLTEFSHYSIPPNIEEALHGLRLKGLVPIITHPERIDILMEERFGLIRQLVEMGCAVQITAGSLTGRFGERAKQSCFKLLGCRMVHFVASDAHNVKHRPPRLNNARRIVAQKYGDEVAQALFVDNPCAAIESRPLPYAPKPQDPPRKRLFGIF